MTTEEQRIRAVSKAAFDLAFKHIKPKPVWNSTDPYWRSLAEQFLAQYDAAQRFAPVPPHKAKK